MMLGRARVRQQRQDQDRFHQRRQAHRKQVEARKSAVQRQRKSDAAKRKARLKRA